MQQILWIFLLITASIAVEGFLAKKPATSRNTALLMSKSTSQTYKSVRITMPDRNQMYDELACCYIIMFM